MKWIFSLVLALLCLAPAAQAGGHFRSGGYGHGGYGYRSFSYAPVFSYALSLPFVPVQAVYAAPQQALYLPPPPPPPSAAPVLLDQAPAYAPAYYAPGYSTGFSGYVPSYDYRRDFYGSRRFHRPPTPAPKPAPAPKAIRRR